MKYKKVAKQNKKRLELFLKRLENGRQEDKCVNISK